MWLGVLLRRLPSLVLRLSPSADQTDTSMILQVSTQRRLLICSSFVLQATTYASLMLMSSLAHSSSQARNHGSRRHRYTSPALPRTSSTARMLIAYWHTSHCVWQRFPTWDAQPRLWISLLLLSSSLLLARLSMQAVWQQVDWR